MLWYSICFPTQYHICCFKIRIVAICYISPLDYCVITRFLATWRKKYINRRWVRRVIATRNGRQNTLPGLNGNVTGNSDGVCHSLPVYPTQVIPSQSVFLLPSQIYSSLNTEFKPPPPLPTISWKRSSFTGKARLNSCPVFYIMKMLFSISIIDSNKLPSRLK